MFMAARPRRSVLYMPATNAKALAKAKTLPADALILDLEDSVAPDQKMVAREQAVEAVRAGAFGGREVVIRVNGPHTPWGEDDLVAASGAAPEALLPGAGEGAVVPPGGVACPCCGCPAAGAPLGGGKVCVQLNPTVAMLLS